MPWIIRLANGAVGMPTRAVWLQSRRSPFLPPVQKQTEGTVTQGRGYPLHRLPAPTQASRRVVLSAQGKSNSAALWGPSASWGTPTLEAASGTSDWQPPGAPLPLAPATIRKLGTSKSETDFAGSAPAEGNGEQPRLVNNRLGTFYCPHCHNPPGLAGVKRKWEGKEFQGACRVHASHPLASR